MSEPIIIVSGVPRSGTSLAMQMLRAGGVPTFTDGVRKADESNPQGYLELEKVRSLPTDRSWLPEVSGQAVKVIHSLLKYLPAEYTYSVVFMHRNLQEVVISQKSMLSRLGKKGGLITDDQLMRIFEKEVEQVLTSLRSASNIRLLELDYSSLLDDPLQAAGSIGEFLQRPLHLEEMVKVVDPALYRSRT